MSWFVSLILNWAWGKLTAFFTGLIRILQRREAIKHEDQNSVQPIKQADPNDAKAIDNAARDALDHM